MAGPVVVVEQAHEGVEVWGIFTTRVLADEFIDKYDDAVRRSEAAGRRGICHVGDLRVLDDVEVDPTSLRHMVSERLYLHAFLP